MAADPSDPYGSTIARIRDALDEVFELERQQGPQALSVAERSNLVAIDEFVRRIDNS